MELPPSFTAARSEYNSQSLTVFTGRTFTQTKRQTGVIKKWKAPLLKIVIICSLTFHKCFTKHWSFSLRDDTKTIINRMWNITKLICFTILFVVSL